MEEITTSVEKTYLQDQAQISISQIAFSEFAIKPSTVIVHDPVSIGAINMLERARDAEDLYQNLLFRQIPDKKLFAQQHQEFVSLLRQHIHEIYYLSDLVDEEHLLEHAQYNPNQIYTRDAIITIPWVPNGYIVGQLKAPIRRREWIPMESALKQIGLQKLLHLPEGLYLEGGDVVPFTYDGKRTLLIGYGRRTRLETLHFLQKALIPLYIDEIIGIKLAEWRINLDGGVLPVAEDVVILHRASIVSSILLNQHSETNFDVLSLFKDLGMQIVEVEKDESIFLQACNCFCLGARQIISYDLSERVDQLLKHHNIETLRFPGSELVKGTGGPRCMTRPIYV